MAFFLGLGTGGVFAWVAAAAPAERVGSVTGIVGAAGGLGGYFPPLVMGATYDSCLPQLRRRPRALAVGPPRSARLDAELGEDQRRGGDDGEERRGRRRSSAKTLP